MAGLTPEEKEKIYQEEKTRKEAQEGFAKEARQKKLTEAYNGVFQHQRNKIIECKHCGYIGLPKKSYNEMIGCILFLLLIVPYIIYYFATSQKKCPNCGSGNLRKIVWQ